MLDLVGNSEHRFSRDAAEYEVTNEHRIDGNRVRRLQSSKKVKKALETALSIAVHILR